MYYRNCGLSVCLKDINDCKLLGKISFDAVFSLFILYIIMKSIPKIKLDWIESSGVFL